MFNLSQYDLMLKFKGIYISQNVPRQGHQLIAYYEKYGIQILILYTNDPSYIEEVPFFVKQISVALSSDPTGDYDVFECGIPFETEEEIKLYVISFAVELVKYRANFAQYLDMLRKAHQG